jgi:hypothetical protein
VSENDWAAELYKQLQSGTKVKLERNMTTMRPGGWWLAAKKKGVRDRQFGKPFFF